MARESVAFDVNANAETLLGYLETVTPESAQLKLRSYAKLGLAPGMDVLDVGCGSGGDLRAIATIVGGSGSVVGIDCCDVMIDATLQRGLPGNAQAVVGRTEALPFDDSAFDAVRIERVFQYLEDPETASREAVRVLRPGGRLAAIDQDWETLTISGSATQLTRRMCNAFCDHVPNGIAGTRNIGMLQRAGLTQLSVDVFAISVPFPVAYAFILRGALDFARSQERVSSAEAARWLADLQMADEFGECVCAFTVFTTVGCKPEG